MMYVLVPADKAANNVEVVWRLYYFDTLKHELMGTYCAPLVVDWLLFCYERDIIMSLSGDKQADIFDTFNTTSRY